MADKRARGNNQKKDASRGGRSQASRKAPSRGPRQGSEPSRRGGVPRERAAVLAGDFIEGRRAAAEALRTGCLLYTSSNVRQALGKKPGEPIRKRQDDSASRRDGRACRRARGRRNVACHGRGAGSRYRTS